MDVSKRLILLIGLSFCLFSITAFAVSPKEIERLIKEGKAELAYELAKKDFDEQAGLPEFDYAYGMAAMAAGYPDDAAFAFERVLIAQPENPVARMELGRAYFVAGDYAAANAEFAHVLIYNPPQNIRNTIEKYYAAMGLRQEDLRLRTTGYVSAGLGVDSNISAATSSGTVSIPALGDIILDPEAISRSDQFSLLGAGITLLKPLSNSTALYARSDLEVRDNLDTRTFDTNIWDVTAGFVGNFGKWGVKIPVTHQTLQLANRTFRRIYTFGSDITRSIGKNHQVGAIAEVAAFRYPKDAVLNVNFYLGGLTYLYTQPSKYFQVLNRIYYAHEDAHDGGEKFNSRHAAGAQVYALWTGFRTHTPYLNFLYQKSRHNQENPLFGDVRRDDLFYVAVGWNWKITPKVLFKLEGFYTKNHSSLELYNYDRESFFFTFHYLFG